MSKRAKSRAFALVLSLFLPAVAPVPTAQNAQNESQAAIQRIEKGLSQPVLVEGDATWTIEERMKHYNVPGLSVAIIKDFKVVWAKAYGVRDVTTKEPVTERTLFQAGSISKPVAATVAMKKVEEGKIRLDEDINAKLKSWKLPDNDLTAKKKVTLGNLLSHTGGLTVHGFPGYEAGAKIPTLPQILDGTPPANTAAVRVDLEPGTRFRYSGGGTTIAQLALQDIEGRPFDAIAKDAVLDPIGMTDSSYAQPLPESSRARAASGHRRDGSLVPGKYHAYPEMAAAGLWTTPTDLAKFAIETQLSFAGKSNKVLSKATVERMLTPFVPDGPGLGFFLEKHGDATYFGHNGADEGFTAMLLVHKEKGYGAALMINSDNFALMPEVYRAIAREYGWEGYPPPLKPVAVAPETLGTYVGRYRAGTDNVFAITVEGGKLYGKGLVGPRVELVPTSPTTFVRRDAEIEYTFARGASGSVDVVLQREGGLVKESPRLAQNDMVPLELLLTGKTTEAIEAYRKLKQRAPYDEVVNENRINGLGYNLLYEQKRKADAIEVFKLNVELYPQSSNTYDSLGEAYMESGNKEEAIRNYKRSLELNPGNTNAVERLKKLEDGR
jgi:CubicO group peptidase (beta-lactamase class C family)